MSEITPWDGRPLEAAIVGLAWPGPGDPAGAFSAAGGGRVVLTPDGRLGDFLAAHPRADYAADLGAVPRAFAAAVGPIVAAGRWCDIGLLKLLVETADLGIRTRPSVRGVPDGWAGRSEERRQRADASRTHADRLVRRVGVDPTLVARFGPLGLGTEVRAAAGARAVGAGLKVLDGRLPGLRAAVEQRLATARRALGRSPAVMSLASQPGGARFLTTGRPVALNDAAQATLVRELRAQLRRRDALPVATPDDLKDQHLWGLLAPFHPVAAAWVELSAAVELAESLEAGGVVRTRVLTFPELRTTGPDLDYLRRLAGQRALAPAEPGRRLLIADIPGLELQCLAACLARTFGDFALTRLIETSGTPGVRHDLARRASGLSEDEYLRLAATGDPAVARSTSLADAALKYFPRGVANRDLEGWLTEFEYGVTPRAREVEAAWRALVEFAPSLPDYCSADVAALVSANLRVTPDGLRAAVAGRRVGGDGRDLATLVGVLARGSDSAEATVAEAVAFFTSRDRFPDAALPADSGSRPGALAASLLASDHATPTGRVYSAAMPVQVFGTDHTGLADAVRKEVLSALVAGGLDVAGFAGDAFAAVVVPGDDPARREAVRNLVLAAVVGVLPDFRGPVNVSEQDAW